MFGTIEGGPIVMGMTIPQTIPIQPNINKRNPKVEESEKKSLLDKQSENKSSIDENKLIWAFQDIKNLKKNTSELISIDQLFSNIKFSFCSKLSLCCTNQKKKNLFKLKNMTNLTQSEIEKMVTVKNSESEYIISQNFQKYFLFHIPNSKNGFSWCLLLYMSACYPHVITRIKEKYNSQDSEQNNREMYNKIDESSMLFLNVLNEENKLY